MPRGSTWLASRVRQMEERVRSSRIILPTVIVTALVAATVGSGAASAAPPAGTNAPVVHQATETEAQVRAYWTPSRMKEAKALEPPAATRTNLTSDPGLRQSPSLPVQSAPGSAPVRGAGKVSATEIGTMAVSQSSVWSTHGVMPARSIGKLYFTTASGDSECSATVITSGNKSLIWTAGHCVADGSNHWYSNFTFVPDYHDGISPLGSWVYKSVTSWPTWVNGQNWDFDFAAITLKPRNNVKVADVTGAQGYKFNGDYSWNVSAFGYPYDTHPARSGIDGQQLRYCGAGTWQVGSKRMGIHCDQGHGSSGGPWLDDLQSARGWGYLVGNISYLTDSSADKLYGPHLGAEAQAVYNTQANS